MPSLQALPLLIGVLASVLCVIPSTVLAGSAACNMSGLTISVTVTHANGRSLYEYRPILAFAAPQHSREHHPSALRNAFFIYIKRGLNDPATGDMVVTVGNPPVVQPLRSVYLANGVSPHGTTLHKVWDNNKHHDAILIPNVTNHDFPIILNVKEREPDRQENETDTTILFSGGYPWRKCGPIEGPMQAQKDSFVGNPLLNSVAEQTFENGCKYSVFSHPVTNVITAMVALTPQGTGNPPDVCTVEPEADCAGETGLIFCPPGRIGQPPLQSIAGGICYYGRIKYRC